MFREEISIDLKQQNKKVEVLSFEKLATTIKSSTAKTIDLTILKQAFELLNGNLRNKQNFVKILQLSDKNVLTALTLIKNLKENKLLNQNSLDEVIKEMATEIEIRQSAVSKISRKESGETRSKFILDEKEKVEIYIQHSKDKEYEGGGYGKIKRGYETNQSKRTKFSIKILMQDDQDKAIDEAKCEAAAHKLLGRTAFYFFRHKKAYVASEWQTGLSLNQYTDKELISEPYEKRILWVLSGFMSLSILHAAFKVHGDIKPKNFILDTDDAVLRLIDFGTTRKRSLQLKIFSCTPEFIPNNEIGTRYGFSTDIYSMAFVVAYIFPELFIIVEKNSKKKIIVKSNNGFSLFEQAIIGLVTLMQRDECHRRPSAADVVKFCKDLSENMKHLSDKTVVKIIKNTIDRVELNVDDVIHKMEMK